MRRSLESELAHEAERRLVAAMMPASPLPMRDLRSTLEQLSELIEAIDRRLPQVQRAGESTIANAAMRLRTEATRRISEIELELSGRDPKSTRPGIVP